MRPDHPLKGAIRPIYPFGPVVGEWKSQGTVAETFARIRRQFIEQQETRVPEPRSGEHESGAAVDLRCPHG